jgi:DNA-binding transcriptional regulator PaaX
LVSLSEKGKLRALNIIFKSFDGKKEKWDGKWRMVCFDIPNSSEKGRKALLKIIQELSPRAPVLSLVFTDIKDQL